MYNRFGFLIFIKMKKNRYILVLFFLASTTYSFAQSALSSDNPFETRATEQARLNILSSVFINQSTTTNSSSLVSNSQVLIQQIGADNLANIQTRSADATIELTQNGNFNATDINIDALSVESTIIQNGNNNSVLDNIYYSNLPVSLNVIQNGDNLTVNRIGTNSLTNRLQLVQQGSSKTITVISN